MIPKEILDRFRIRPGAKVRLRDHNTCWRLTGEMEELGKSEIKSRARKILDANRAELAEAQDLLYADNRHSVLVILQAMDAGGKDGTIKHVMSAANPQGCQVSSFKQPTPEDLDHNFLWRYVKRLPERGCIGIFNRSYYEDVLVVRVHPDRLGPLPRHLKIDKSFWRARFDDINAMERHLAREGTVIVKIFLHISKDEQRKRFLERLERPEKHWKFSPSDLAERAHWDEYMKIYEDTLSATSTEWAPWHVVPADYKWVARAVVADLVTGAIRGLDLRYPEIDDDQRRALAEARRVLLEEK